MVRKMSVDTEDKEASSGVREVNIYVEMFI